MSLDEDKFRELENRIRAIELVLTYGLRIEERASMDMKLRWGRTYAEEIEKYPYVSLGPLQEGPVGVMLRSYCGMFDNDPPRLHHRRLPPSLRVRDVGPQGGRADYFHPQGPRHYVGLLQAQAVSYPWTPRGIFVYVATIGVRRRFGMGYCYVGGTNRKRLVCLLLFVATVGLITHDPRRIDPTVWPVEPLACFVAWGCV